MCLSPKPSPPPHCLPDVAFTPPPLSTLLHSYPPRSPPLHLATADRSPQPLSFPSATDSPPPDALSSPNSFSVIALFPTAAFSSPDAFCSTTLSPLRHRSLPSVIRLLRHCSLSPPSPLFSPRCLLLPDTFSATALSPTVALSSLDAFSATALSPLSCPPSQPLLCLPAATASPHPNAFSSHEAFSATTLPHRVSANKCLTPPIYT